MLEQGEDWGNALGSCLLHQRIVYDIVPPTRSVDIDGSGEDVPHDLESAIPSGLHVEFEIPVSKGVPEQVDEFLPDVVCALFTARSREVRLDVLVDVTCD